MLCPNCQFENPEGIKFCGECGAKLEILCPSCNSSNPPNFKFCGECGHSLIEVAQETTPIKFSEPQSYTPKFLADKILTTRSSIEGERKLVSVLFADVANYTGMSEKLDPEEVHQIMDGCFKILMDEIHRYEGTINQFTGDGVMALFGAPVAHEDHAQRACRAALSIQKVIAKYGERLKRDPGIDFSMRIGINSGPVVVGSIGNDLRMDYTAVGDTTNLAARMEGDAQAGSILVSDNTYRVVKDYFEFKPVGKAVIKGKKQPQNTYGLIKASETETRIKAAVVKGLTKFVGRKNSMAALMEPLEKVLAGSGQVVGIVGEAGVGKSRFLLEFRKRLQKKEVKYLEGRCLHYGGSILYMPILEILKSYFSIKEEDQESVAKNKIEDTISNLDKKLTGAIAPIQDLLSLKTSDKEYLNLEPKQKREKTFEALRDVFITLGQSRPLLLVVEDLHWIDKTSQEFLDYLIGWLANARIMLILLYRPEYTHQWGSKSYYNNIGLIQLGTDSSTKLVHSILEGGDIAPELEHLILSRSSGNPLFMEELTYSLLENGTIQKENHKYTLDRGVSDIQVGAAISCHGAKESRKIRCFNAGGMI
jgi:class 3 adenylate cyclase